MTIRTFTGPTVHMNYIVYGHVTTFRPRQRGGGIGMA